MNENAEKQLAVGWAQTDITPDRPVFLCGQFYERISRYVHDPLTATALALDSGDDQAVIVSLDMAMAPAPVLARVRELLAGEPGLQPGKITFSATHTHTSLSPEGNGLVEMYETVFGSELVSRLQKPANLMDDAEVASFLADKLLRLVRAAWRSRAPGGASSALDYAAVAFNRRPVFHGGGSVMYGACSRGDFMRLEGPSDHTADMLYTWDGSGNLTGVVVNIPCPSQVMELHCFISADYWDSARNAIRSKLGNVYILPLCGAAGDQNPLDLIRISKTNEEALAKWGAQTGEVFRDFDMSNECRDIGERIAEAVERGWRKARNRIQTDAILLHQVEQVDLPIRTVTAEDYAASRGIVDEVKARFSKQNPMRTADMVPLFKDVGTVLRWQLQQKTQTFRFELHVIRLGDLAITTNPFELFTEFGMRIKARSPAAQTMLAQLSNSNGGYLPTETAIAKGSYSSTPASTMCGPDAGTVLVEKTLSVMEGLWQ